MRYVSTRSELASQQGVSFCAAVLEGLAPDGGLYVPKDYPKIDLPTLHRLSSLSYADLAFEVMSRWIDDIPHEDLKKLIGNTYTSEVFGSDEITPVLKLKDGLFLLRVSFGPTLAFKDIAMQWLGHLFQYILEREKRTMNILGATSGDTGSSAEYAMRGKKNINVFMLSPHQRMTPFQQAQMYSLADPNIFNIAVEGTFDSCQDMVKAVAGDQAFKRRYRLGAVNSINWARVMAQMVYYFKGYFSAVASIGSLMDVSVPTGNFGNILAAYLAKKMGLPIRRLILATNENNVLDEFYKTGKYRPRPASETFATSSPSMDISKASNFERFIFDATDRDARLMNQLWGELREHGAFDLTRPQYARVWANVKEAGFVSGSSTHQDRLDTIAALFDRYQVIIDPHTADGVKVGLNASDGKVPLICIETALPAKFETTIKDAIGQTPSRPKSYQDLESRPKHFSVLPADVDQLKAFIEKKVS
ncbi:MAG: threonine synthase [Burkholderiales bacterium]|jgi:threonine synthase|nr:threonine synthase [Burkholderiales bacterium]